MLMAAASGIAQGLTMMVINASAMKETSFEMDTRYLALFLLLICAYVYARYWALTNASGITERAIREIRDRMATKIRLCDLQDFERIGRTDFFAPLSRDTQTISETSQYIINASASIVMLVFAGFYMYTISQTAVFVTVIVTTICSVYFLKSNERVQIFLSEAHRAEGGFFDLLGHVLDGFKEIKMNRARTDDLYDNYLKPKAHVAADAKQKVHVNFAKTFIFAQAFFYLLVASVVFILPQITLIESGSLMQLTALTLFLIGPIGDVVGCIPYFCKANVAVANLEALEARLEEEIPQNGDADSPTVRRMQQAAVVEKLEVRDVTFSYFDKFGKPLFTLGPINFSARHGEIVFIVGGNGSGKSTLLKVLAGLYHPVTGRIFLNGIQVDPYSCGEYREKISAVFADYHLFDRLYGLPDATDEKIGELLATMRLENCTGIANGRFTNVELSTGQRKRLGLMVALLEDRPVYIFDEVAADQDPQFREYLYRTILTDLKKRGKTLIVVSHDDRYFDVADRIVKMDYGRIAEESN